MAKRREGALTFVEAALNKGALTFYEGGGKVEFLKPKIFVLKTKITNIQDSKEAKNDA